MSKSICDHNSPMQVIKRDGRIEKVSLDKVTNRIETLCQLLKLDRVNATKISIEVVQFLADMMSTEEIDYFIADKCAEKILSDPQYGKLAAGILVSNIHKTTPPDFLKITEQFYNNLDSDGKHVPMVTEEYYEFVKKYADRINSEIDYVKDFNFDFFSVATMERAYLFRRKHTNDTKFQNIRNKKETLLREKYGRIAERPQHMIMRVALGIHGSDIEKAIETYKLISDKYFTQASPCIYNAGTKRPQLSSCFLLGMDDSIDGIFKTITDIAKISKWAGGIGVHISDIRAYESPIRGTQGTSDGIVPLAKTINEVARYVNQGGRRNGAVALYIEVWHYDIFKFIDLKKAHGSENLRARDIFLALWTCDLFMKRVVENKQWSLMCPDQCPGLTDKYGKEFEELYLKYEKEGRYKKQIRAVDLWFHILSAQIETGVPYMAFKDQANRKSNQKNIGTIKSSNLCCEIVEYSSSTEYAVCTLASICLQRFIEEDENGEPVYNFDKLCQVAQVVTRNLDKIIDINYYPVPETHVSNMRHRPIGIGVQGLADTYCLMGYPFDSPEARELNKKMFETIYFGAVTASNELAKEKGPYSTFEGSPASKGKLQFHLWGLTIKDLLMKWDWNALIESVKQYGLRNSLLTAVMPTASTAHFMGSNECIEPFTCNLYTRSTLAGTYVVINKHLVNDLIKLGLWTKEIREELLYDSGSVQKITEIPNYIKKRYTTAFEMGFKPIVDQSIERGPFIDQSQSLNLFSNKPDFKKLGSAHIYSWKGGSRGTYEKPNGLKTGMYYLRSRSAVDPIKFGLDPAAVKRIENKRGITKINSQNTRKLEQRMQILQIEQKDPRRISEIEESVSSNVLQRSQNYKECDMCS